MDRFTLLVGLFFGVALMAGGSSADAVSAGVVRVCGVPILAIGLWRLVHEPVSPGAIWPLLLVVAVIALTLVQLIPLPPAMWSTLAGRRDVLDGYAAAGLTPPPWLPISLTPWATRYAALGLIPPVAMFCSVVTLAEPSRRVLAAVAAGVAIVSVGLGVLQVAGGFDSPLRLYAITNPESAVGFFANRNHQAAFLAATIPLAAYLMARRSAGGGMGTFFWSASTAGFVLIVGVGAAATGSRAGASLMVLGILGAIAVAAMGARRILGRRFRWAPATALAISAVFVLVLIVSSDNSLLRAHLQTNLGEDIRFEINPVVIKAGARFAPLGSGVGSFPVVYQMFERPQTLTQAYINHAHNDYLEVWLECGWAGLALITAFAVWWVATVLGAFRARLSASVALPMAGALIVMMLLRTPALATLFALGCGLMLPPPRSAPVSERRSHRR